MAFRKPRARVLEYAIHDLGTPTRPPRSREPGVNRCQYGVCVDTETVAIKLAEADMLAIAGLQSSSPQALLAVRYKSHTGLAWNDEIAPAEAAGLLMAVDAWRKIHGFATSADN